MHRCHLFLKLFAISLFPLTAIHAAVVAVEMSDAPKPFDPRMNAVDYYPEYEAHFYTLDQSWEYRLESESIFIRQMQTTVLDATNPDILTASYENRINTINTVGISTIHPARTYRMAIESNYGFELDIQAIHYCFRSSYDKFSDRSIITISLRHHDTGTDVFAPIIFDSSKIDSSMQPIILLEDDDYNYQRLSLSQGDDSSLSALVHDRVTAHSFNPSTFDLEINVTSQIESQEESVLSLSMIDLLEVSVSDAVSPFRLLDLDFDNKDRYHGITYGHNPGLGYFVWYDNQSDWVYSFDRGWWWLGYHRQMSAPISPLIAFETNTNSWLAIDWSLYPQVWRWSVDHWQEEVIE